MRVFLRRRHSLRVSYLLIALLVLLGGAAGTPSVSHAQAPTPTPAPPPRVLAIEVVGNRHIPTEQILAVITLKVGDILTPEQLRRDGEAVAGLGWFADVSLRVESDPAGVRVVFLLVENPVITEVVVEGNTVIGTPEILRALNIPIGQVLNSKQTREGVRAVEKLYEDKGYVLARVIDISLEPAGDGRLRVRVAGGRRASPPSSASSWPSAIRSWTRSAPPWTSTSSRPPRCSWRSSAARRTPASNWIRSAASSSWGGPSTRGRSSRCACVPSAPRSRRCRSTPATPARRIRATCRPTSRRGGPSPSPSPAHGTGATAGSTPRAGASRPFRWSSPCPRWAATSTSRSTSPSGCSTRRSAASPSSPGASPAA